MDRQGLGVVSRAAHVKGGALRGAEGGQDFLQNAHLCEKTRILANKTSEATGAGAAYRVVTVRGGTYQWEGVSLKCDT